MKNKISHIIKGIFPVILSVLLQYGCADNEIDSVETPSVEDQGIGQMVLFSSGNEANAVTRADIVPYMEDGGRFVCKMYYHAGHSDTDASDYDTETTPITSWLQVKGNYGNSLYRKSDFSDVENTNDPIYTEYEFDPDAQIFYWRNRLDHVFLAYTDFNQLKTNLYGSNPRQLFMYPDNDAVFKTRLPDDIIWNNESSSQLVLQKVSTSNPDYSLDDKQVAEEAGNTYEVPEYLVHYELKEEKTTGVISNNSSPIDDALKVRIREVIEASTNYTEGKKAALIEDLNRIAPSPEETLDGKVYRNTIWGISYNSNHLVDGQVDLFDQDTKIFYIIQRKSIIENWLESPANSFDLKRGDNMDSMTDQPDPLIALTKMKPTGATQEANRVRLYFKHQFSQIQVNLTNAENTDDIKPGNIISVELLGVSQKGYVFTTITPDGKQISPAYDPVDVTKFSKDIIRDNPYATSFNMFDMGTSKPNTSLKSFNAIAFGKLQAIRITWEENNGIEHKATFKIQASTEEKDDFQTLRSGIKYIYDFELQRGTIAYIRAEIVPWQLSEELNYDSSGYIKN